MSTAAFESTEDFAHRLDREDPLAHFREQFHIPLTESGEACINAPILQMAALRASLELFDEAGMPELRKKGDRLTGYLEYLLDQLPNKHFRIITPRDPAQRASQLSLQVPAGSGRKLLAGLERAGVICDYREPDIIRVAPVPLYNSFLDVWRFVNALSETRVNE